MLITTSMMFWRKFLIINNDKTTHPLDSRSCSKRSTRQCLQLLLHFSMKCLFRRLSIFDMTAWKFPTTFRMLHHQNRTRIRDRCWHSSYSISQNKTGFMRTPTSILDIFRDRFQPILLQRLQDGEPRRMLQKCCSLNKRVEFCFIGMNYFSSSSSDSMTTGSRFLTYTLIQLLHLFQECCTMFKFRAAPWRLFTSIHSLG